MDVSANANPGTDPRYAQAAFETGRTLAERGITLVFGGGKVGLMGATADGAFSIAGGGDTLAAIAKYGIEKDVGYISTGGGAFLEVLEGKTLPAFEILTQRAAG